MEPLVLSEKRGRVGWVTLNRPKALNALNDALIDQLVGGSARVRFREGRRRDRDHRQR